MKSNLNKSNKKSKTVVVFYLLVAVFMIYGLAEIIYSIINNGFGAVFDIIFTVIIGGIFSFIFLASAKGTWGKFLRSKGKVKQADEFDDAVNQIQTNDKAHINFNLENFLIGLSVLIIFGGIGIGVVCWGNAQLQKITGEDYVATTATIERVESVEINENTNNSSSANNTMYSLCYSFTSDDGNKYYATESTAWGKINFKEGNEVKIFYNRENPKEISTLSTPISLICGGSFFIAVSFLFFLIKLGLGYDGKTNRLTTLIVGSIFAGFGITLYVAVYLASGGSIISLILNGAIMYALGCFVLVGILCIVSSVIGVLKNIFCYNKHK